MNSRYKKHGKYRSGFEKTFAGLLTKHKIPFEYETTSFTFKSPLGSSRASCSECGSKQLIRLSQYTPDFKLTDHVFIETKGNFTAKDRRKMVSAKAHNPDVNFILYFHRDNKLSKASHTRYSDWCTANGFEYYVHTKEGFDSFLKWYKGF